MRLDSGALNPLMMFLEITEPMSSRKKLTDVLGIILEKKPDLEELTGIGPVTSANQEG